MPDADEPTVACPTCSGPLTTEGKDWRCEVGHRFTFPELADGQAEAVVRALWYALRALEDRAISSRFMAAQFDQDSLKVQADRERVQAVADLAMVDELHDLLRNLEGVERRPAGHAASIAHGEPSGQGSHS